MMSPEIFDDISTAMIFNILISLNTEKKTEQKPLKSGLVVLNYIQLQNVMKSVIK